MSSGNAQPNPFQGARPKIIRDYARWTALSALRSGRHQKSRLAIYTLLDLIPFEALLTDRAAPVSPADFAKWHEDAIVVITRNSELSVGWAAKLVNVYLKTAVYVGGLGHPGLAELLHPPIDAGLWSGLKGQHGKGTHIYRKTHSRKTIASIDTYDAYLEIIDGCRMAAESANCSLIEVEQWWQGAGA